MNHLTDAEVDQLDQAMSDHMHGHVVSNSPYNWGCDSHCRKEALRRAVDKVLLARSQPVDRCPHDYAPCPFCSGGGAT